jgi:rubredoxin
MFLPKPSTSQSRDVPMQKIVSIICPKCNNQKSFYRYGKDCDGYQKYQYRNCWHQFAPERSSEAREGAGQTGRLRRRDYPPCPVCGKTSFLHHNYGHYSNYRCYWNRPFKGTYPLHYIIKLNVSFGINWCLLDSCDTQIIV